METLSWWLVGALVVGVLVLGVWWAGRGGGAEPVARFAEPAPDPVSPKGYSPLNVGNDASARPWESHSLLPDDAEPVTRSAQTLPSGFDVAAFLEASRRNFIHLQAAWDRADMDALRAMMTDAMLSDIQAQLSERERSGAGNQTDVVMLEAKLIAIEDMPEGYLASVEFSGLIREELSAGPNPFREIWSITRPREGNAGWLVAGVQALQ